MPKAHILCYVADQIGEIHPFIYGHFIEHLAECIYGGLWAEMLANRKFAGHDQPPGERPSAESYGIPHPWHAVNRTRRGGRRDPLSRHRRLHAGHGIRGGRVEGRPRLSTATPALGRCSGGMSRLRGRGSTSGIFGSPASSGSWQSTHVRSLLRCSAWFMVGCGGAGGSPPPTAASWPPAQLCRTRPPTSSTAIKSQKLPPLTLFMARTSTSSRGRGRRIPCTGHRR